MAGFSSTIGAVVQDPLVVVLALFVVGVVVSHLLFRDHPMGRAIVRVIFLILLTFALLHADIVPYRPSDSTGTALRDVARSILKIAWWVWAAWFVVGLLRASLIVERRPHEGRLLQDLIAGLIYLAALLAVIAYVFDLPIQGLLATSGVIAIILGLALQSTLGDVFSGIVLNFTRPYRPGDWVSIDNGTDGRVIEINWRATHILTAKRDLAIIPNSTIAKSKIINVSSPSGIHGVTVTVQADSRTGPASVIEFLEHAVLNCRLILPKPAPMVTIKGMNAGYSEFSIDFFVESLGVSAQAQNELFDLIYRHLAAAGIDLAPPADQPFTPASGRARESSQTKADALLERTSIFASLTPQALTSISTKLQLRSYAEGETLVRQGPVGQSLFIVATGVISYRRDDGESEEELLRLGPGDHFGEIGVLTGAASRVRVTALTPALVYELPKDVLEPVLKAFPQVSQALNQTATRRQTAINPAAAESETEVPSLRLRSRLSEWLHRRYDLVAPK